MENTNSQRFIYFIFYILSVFSVTLHCNSAYGHQSSNYTFSTARPAVASIEGGYISYHWQAGTDNYAIPITPDLLEEYPTSGIIIHPDIPSDDQLIYFNGRVWAFPLSIVFCSANRFPINAFRQVRLRGNAANFSPGFQGVQGLLINAVINNGIYRYEEVRYAETDIRRSSDDWLSTPANFRYFTNSLIWNMYNGDVYYEQSTTSRHQEYFGQTHWQGSWSVNVGSYDSLIRESLVNPSSESRLHLHPSGRMVDYSSYDLTDHYSTWNRHTIPCESTNQSSIRLHSLRRFLMRDAMITARELDFDVLLDHIYSDEQNFHSLAAPALPGTPNPNIAVISVLVGDPLNELTLEVSDGSASGLGQIASYDSSFISNGGESLHWTTSIRGFPSQYFTAPDGTQVFLALLRASEPIQGGAEVTFQLTARQGDATTSFNGHFFGAPVLLAHGLWARADHSWDSLERALRYGTPAAYVGRVNYPNTTSFIDSEVQDAFRLDGINATLRETERRGIIAYNVTVIGHSMGGLVARAHGMGLDRARPYLNASNFYLGDIGRIITLNSPHRGSPLAAELLDVGATSIGDMSGICGQAIVQTGATAAATCLLTAMLVALQPSDLYSLMEILGWPMGSAHEALAPNSTALETIAANAQAGIGQNLSYEAVGSRLPSTSFLEITLDLVRRLVNIEGTVDSLLGGDMQHDGIVGITSQLAGAAHAQSFDGYSHIANPFGALGVDGIVEAEEIAAFVVCRIRNQADCMPENARHFSNQELTTSIDFPDLTGRTELRDAIDILLVGDPTVSPPGPITALRPTLIDIHTHQQLGQVIAIINDSNGMTLVSPIFINNNYYEITFRTSGLTRIVFLALLGEEHYSINAIEINVAPAPARSGLSIVPSEIFMDTVGNSRSLSVILEQAGRITFLEPPSLSYSILSLNNPAISISEEGIIHGLRQGVSTFVVNYDDAQFVSRAYVGLTDLPNVPGRRVLAATLPNSRAVQVGSTATIFATMLNSSLVDAVGCGVDLPVPGLHGQYYFRTTDPATNALIGINNRRVDIPPGAAQSFVISFTPSEIFHARELEFSFSCENAQPARTFPGANTWILSSSETPVADIIVVYATPSNDGFVRIPGNNGVGIVAVSVANVGATEILTISANTGDNDLGISIAVCETNPLNGQCITPRAESVMTEISTGETPTFAFFVRGNGASVAPAPADNRLFLEFSSDGLLRGSTSVAVVTD